MQKERFDGLDGAGPPNNPPQQHGLPSNKMAQITSDCDAMRLHAHRRLQTTLDCVPLQANVHAPNMDYHST